MTPDDFATRLRAYCVATNGSVSSWGRTRKHNKKVKGVPASLHPAWLAGDVIYDEPLDIATRQRYAKAFGLLIVEEDTHDHLQAAGV